MDSDPGNLAGYATAIRNSQRIFFIEFITDKCCGKQIGRISFKSCIGNYLVSMRNCIFNS